MFNLISVGICFGVYFITLFNGIDCQVDKTEADCGENEIFCKSFSDLRLNGLEGSDNPSCLPKELVCQTEKVYCAPPSYLSLSEKCSSIVCNQTQYQCACGGCIPLSSRCNSIAECFDASDERFCKDNRATLKCPTKRQVSCLSGECIKKNGICDGIKDCNDNSDETFSLCFNNRCPSGTFKCSYGACIDSEAVCNGEPDCVDYSDELLPECKAKLNVTSSDLICGENNFKCNSGLCIKKEKLCDSILDCDDGSDETYRACKNKTCSDNLFQCAYGACVELEAQCNGKLDCVDGTDEFGCCGKDKFDCLDRNLFFTNKNRCIKKEKLCDGIRDCDNGLDEMDSQCKNKTRGCYFPDQPDNGVVKTSLGMVPQPNKPAENGTILFYTCNEGYSLDTTSQAVVCVQDTWTVYPLPACLKKCSVLASPKHEIECRHEGKVISCEKALEGTVANIKCKDAFEIENFIYQPYSGIQCTKNGNWSNELFDCSPECGTLTPKGQALVIKGYTAAEIEFPWHAGVYKIDDYKGKKYYEQICGGTLISEKIIISAAHCFWDFNYNKPNVDTEKYAVAVGKFYRSWNSTKDKKYTQHRMLQRIVLPRRFRAEGSSFANDIAVLIVKDIIQLTSRVRPICVDWGNELSKTLLKSGALGTVAGWGLTEEFGNAAEELQAVRMPYVEEDVCVNSLPKTFKTFITHDKICAGYNNGTTVCTGDSGGGLAFNKNNRYFLQGIVSISPAKGTTCDSYQYVAFTSVSQHLDFIMEIERENH